MAANKKVAKATKPTTKKLPVKTAPKKGVAKKAETSTFDKLKAQKNAIVKKQTAKIVAKATAPKRAPRKAVNAAPTIVQGTISATLGDAVPQEPTFWVREVFVNNLVVFCLANDNKIYRWETKSGEWRVHADPVAEEPAEVADTPLFGDLPA